MSKLTQASKGCTCIKCHRPHAYACHYNGPRQMDFGKGRGIKCDDTATADFCQECDQEFTEGSTNERWSDKWDRSEEFMYWIILSNIRRFELGILTVGAGKHE